MQIASATNQNVIVGNTSGRVLTEVLTSGTSTTDPVTLVRTDTAVGPLFTVTAVTQPGAGPSLLPDVTVNIVNPPQVITAQATSLSVNFDPVTMVFTETIVTPLLTLNAVALPGPGMGTVTLTLTLP
jgi:hypothetical protein